MKRNEKDMRIYHLYIYGISELDFTDILVHESEIAAQNHFDALNTVLFVLNHHARFDNMEFTSCRLFDVTNVKEINHLGEEIAGLYITSSDMRK